MQILSLAIKSLWHRRLATSLTVVAISLSVALFVGVGKTKEATRDAFSGAISRVDLIVGPRTGSLSLLLYSVFHVGSPSHNVSMRAVDHVKSLEKVAWVVPFSLGDGFKGFPVVGTTADFFQHFKYGDARPITFFSGRSFSTQNEVVIGFEVANSRSLSLGDKIVLSHGHTEDGDGFEKHEDHPFTVVGITQFTGTPIDRSLYVSLEGMGAIHSEVSPPAHSKINGNNAAHNHQEGKKHQDSKLDQDHHHAGHSDEHDHEHDHDHSSFTHDDGKILVKYVSGFFVGAKNRMSALELQRDINTWPSEALLAIMPGMAMAELWKNLSIFETAMSVISFFVVVTGMIGLFVSLLIVSGQRQREMIILRAVGCGPATIFSLLAGEAVCLVILGIGLGLGVMYSGLFALSPWIERKFAVNLQLSGVNLSDLTFVAALTVVGGLVGILSSIRAYRTAMHDGLATKF